jgi:hypothetical protein
MACQDLVEDDSEDLAGNYGQAQLLQLYGKGCSNIELLPKELMIALQCFNG